MSILLLAKTELQVFLKSFIPNYYIINLNKKSWFILTERF